MLSSLYLGTKCNSTCAYSGGQQSTEPSAVLTQDGLSFNEFVEQADLCQTEHALCEFMRFPNRVHSNAHGYISLATRLRANQRFGGGSQPYWLGCLSRIRHPAGQPRMGKRCRRDSERDEGKMQLLGTGTILRRGTAAGNYSYLPTLTLWKYDLIFRVSRSIFSTMRVREL